MQPRWVLLSTIFLLAALAVSAQDKPTWSAREQPIADQLRGLRLVPDDARGAVTRKLAAEIRGLPAGPNKLRLADGLANLATEGDFGRQTLQDVADTLAETLRERPLPDEKGKPAMPYRTLAQLIRYEQVPVSFEAPPLAAALAQLEEQDRRRASADFALRDLEGKEWKLSGLAGKVVLVNFWATWCPPCRKEMPDLGALYARFREQGLVILGISDDDPGKVAAFVKEHGVRYPVLLDPGSKVSTLFGAEGIPKSYVYDRDGKLVATAIDMRTMGQFLAMLSKTGLR
ncbi:MAG TPA: TlpA disulfide reductase family protein [Bryobacteraceae bacterium]|nr:TlpA disulfide reductase family protein [Bryobacteraceae bacterium]